MHVHVCDMSHDSTNLIHSDTISFGPALEQIVGSLFCRNFFTLTSAHLEQLLAAFEASLQDDKLEIRTLASNTLSGVIKVLPPDLFESIQSKIVKEAQAAFPGRKQQPTTAPSVVQLHSCVLKLAALLQSSPYELADWYAPSM